MTPLDPDAVVGCLLGQAVGDMMGLPAENLSRRRIAKLFPTFDRPRFIFGHGMGSDDTEHACMTAQALLRSGGDVNRFRRSLAWRLRWWFLGMPAGIGLATLKSCIRLWLGFPSDRSGVYSAGNGPAMRAAILFVTAGIEEELDRQFGIDCAFGDNNGYIPWLSDATAITHRDPQALGGTIVVQSVARSAYQSREEPLDVENAIWWVSFGTQGISVLRGSADDLERNVARIEPAYRRGISVEEFTSELGLSRGVSGYIAHSVPVAIYAFLRHPDDYRTAIESVIRCGGDTDTVASITGALVGIRVGKAGIPSEWLARYADWPRSAAWIEALGRRLAEGTWRKSPQPAVPLAWWAVPVRNLVFFLIVLGHVARRLLPPY